MSINKMHADQFDIDADLVRKLLKSQFPKWKDLKLEVIRPEGTDNAMYKLGNDKVVRLPRMPSSTSNIEKEIHWLPKLGPNLPITIPKLLACGKPTVDYPFSWLICQWLEGKNPSADNILDYQQAAVDLGGFVKAMQKISCSGAPTCNRGKPLSSRDEETREAIVLSAKFFDRKLLTKFWNDALEIPTWKSEPVWIHGDLHAGNLLAKNGRITAVVDFGSAGIGDPAVDLMLAWTLLTKESRQLFRSIVNPDDPTWERARAWALSFGIVAYPYYRNSNPVFAAIAKNAVDEVIADLDLDSDLEDD